MTHPVALVREAQLKEILKVILSLHARRDPLTSQFLPLDQQREEFAEAFKLLDGDEIQ